MTTHTPGHWRAVGTFVITDNGPDICSTSNVNNQPIEEQIANARLIAAAPALLVVSHNLANTMGIDYAIKKLSTISDDTMALGAATILKGIQQQAQTAIAQAEKG